MLTALEALKIDTALWREVMQGGFNTLDNFLFTGQDFINPNQSLLFKRLYGLNSISLNYYLDKLKGFCIGEYTLISKPSLSDNVSFFSPPLNNIPKEHLEFDSIDFDQATIDNSIPIDKFKVITNNGSAFVLTSTFQKLGNTPLLLDKIKYEGKLILISNGKETKSVKLTSNENVIEVVFK